MHGFPTTINGKTDRDALKIDMTEIVTRENQEEESFTPDEKKIYEIWCEALKTTDISATDNFFEIGGNSLLAISVFSKIENAFGMELGLRTFFDSPRIKDLAEIIDLLNFKHGKPETVSRNGDNSKIVGGEI
jgi:acyl carrier protein